GWRGVRGFRPCGAGLPRPGWGSRVPGRRNYFWPALSQEAHIRQALPERGAPPPPVVRARAAGAGASPPAQGPPAGAWGLQTPSSANGSAWPAATAAWWGEGQWRVWQEGPGSGPSPPRSTLSRNVFRPAHRSTHQNTGPGLSPPCRWEWTPPTLEAQLGRIRGQGRRKEGVTGSCLSSVGQTWDLSLPF
ncbi:unnamed protein product, partial [Gulo gulo]